MMRSIIIGLSVIFFSMTAIVTFKFLKLPVYAKTYQDYRPEIMSIPEPAPDAFSFTTEDPESRKVFTVGEEKAITQLENQLAPTQSAVKNNKTVDTNYQSQTLTIFGGKTFRSGQDIIQDVAYATIENLVKEISLSPGSRILIEGHTDNVPTGKLGSDNMDLSLRRAKAIANILVLHGISMDRISVTGYGDTRPIYTNTTEEGRAKNRRVEVKLMPQEGNN